MKTYIPTMLLSFFITLPIAWSWSSSLSRRQLIESLVAGGSLLAAAAPAGAACLQGDLSPDCIGVYKVPIDDAILPYVGTPEALKRFAPDLKYVPPIQAPKSFDIAMEILQTQRLAADDITAVVSAGRLEEAGIKVLNLLPKVASAGQVVFDVLQGELSSNTSTSASVKDMQSMKLQQQLDMVLGYWGETDVTIGQGIRGDLGVSARAQLEILASLKDARAALDEFLFVASRRAA